MGKRAYILIFDRDDEMDYKMFHQNITALPEILNWWHYIKSSYILISDISSATRLTELIREIIPSSKKFLLLEANLKNRNGFLPVKAWDWLKRQQAAIEKK